jgi:hypothetical protein
MKNALKTTVLKLSTGMCLLLFIGGVYSNTFGQESRKKTTIATELNKDTASSEPAKRLMAACYTETWNSSTQYGPDNSCGAPRIYRVNRSGKNYTARYCGTNLDPITNCVPGWDDWIDEGACSSCTNASISSHPSTSAASTCLNGTAFTALSVTAAGSATLSYQWQSSTQSNFASGVSNVGTNSASYTPVNTVAGTLYYRCVVTTSCNSTTATSNASGAITVNTLPTTVTVTGGGAICSGSSTNLGASNGSSGTIYWQNTTSSGTSTATASTSQSVSSAGTYYFRAQSAQGCWGTQGSATITVNNLPTITASSGAARGTTSTATIQATSNIGSISWYAASSGGSSLGTSNSGVNWTTPAIASTTAYYAEAVIGSCVSATRTSVSATASDNLLIIGKSTGSSFSQKQSNTSSDSLRVFVSTYAANNAANVGTITNNESFIAISHNGGLLKATTTSNTEKPVGIVSRLAREWQITNTNFVDNFSLEIEWDVTGNVDLNDIRLLVDDDGDFSNATAYGTSDGLTFEFGSIIIRGIGTSKIPSGSSKYVTIGSTNAATPLPVGFLLFKAELVHDYVDIHWKTATETNNNYFIVQKSTNGRTWENIDRVEGAKNSTQILGYKFDDRTPYLGTSYYRIKQVDMDDKFTYSEIKALDINNLEHTDIHVSPNPTTGLFTIKGEQIAVADIAIFDIHGKDVTALAKMQDTQNEIHVDLESLNDGVYILKIKDTVCVKIDKI